MFSCRQALKKNQLNTLCLCIDVFKYLCIILLVLSIRLLFYLPLCYSSSDCSSSSRTFFSLCQLSLIWTVFQYPIWLPLLANFYAGIFIIWAPQVALGVKNPPANAGDIRDTGSIPGWGRSPGGGNGNPLQYFCPGNPTDRRTWRVVNPWSCKELDTTKHMFYSTLGKLFLSYHF